MGERGGLTFVALGLTTSALLGGHWLSSAKNWPQVNLIAYGSQRTRMALQSVTQKLGSLIIPCSKFKLSGHHLADWRKYGFHLHASEWRGGLKHRILLFFSLFVDFGARDNFADD
jgi:hypothetical protein